MIGKRGRDHKNRLGSLIAIFVLWPIVSLMMAIRQFRFKESRVVFVLFALLLGFAFDFSDPLTDGSRYAQWFIEYGNKTFNDFLQDLSNLGQYGNTDIYTTCSYFLFSRFTSNPHVLFVAWAGIYFFFLVKFLGTVIDYINEKSYRFQMPAVVFFIGLTLFMPLNAINGVRMWTAFVVFFYAVAKILLKNDNRYFALAAGTVLIHFSFIFSLVFLGFYRIFRNRPVFFYCLLLISFVGSLSFSTVFAPYVDSLGEGIEQKVGGYLNDEYIALRAEAKAAQVWYAEYRQSILQYFLYVALAISYFWLKRRKVTPIVRQCFYFTIVMWSMFNFSSATAVQGRYFFFFAFSALLFLTLAAFELRSDRTFRKIAYCAIPPLAIWIGVGQLNAIQSFDYLVLVGNIFTFPFIFFNI